MISQWLAEKASVRPDRLFLSLPPEGFTYAACVRRMEQLTQELGAFAGAPVGITGDSNPQSLLRLFALDRLNCTVHLLSSHLQTDILPRLADQFRFQWVAEGPAGLRPVAGGEPLGEPGNVVLYTSGTTGLPKGVRHTWKSLAARVYVSPALADSRWLLTYGLSTFAGVQVFLHALLNGAQLTLGEGNPAALAELARRDRITHISGTPTFFRLLLATGREEDLAGLHLRQVTLGGELVDQAILDSLRQRFPQAQVTQIYASTEVGVCFSVHDGRAGFPASFLEDPGLPLQLRIVDGELLVRSGHAGRLEAQPGNTSESESFFPTGDLVERRGDRVHFLGRKEDRINVGGSKVFPAEVEEVLLQLDCVESVRVYGEPSSLAGHLVSACVVLKGGRDEAVERPRLLAHCRQKLQPFKVPRILHFVRALPVTPSGKLVRN